MIYKKIVFKKYNKIIFNLSSTFVITILDLLFSIFKIFCNSSAFLELRPTLKFFRLDIKYIYIRYKNIKYNYKHIIIDNKF